MTTESKQDTRLRAVAPASGVLWASLVVVAMLLLLVVCGALIDGSSGAWGALAGGAIALAVFAFGTTVLHVVIRVMPAASLLLALLTYTLQVVSMALAIAALNASGAAGESVSRGWFAAGVITVTAVWLVTQVWHATHLRLPAYDLVGNDSSGAANHESEAGA